jgi:formylglycine-generating enzyme required for sulfatase activity
MIDKDEELQQKRPRKFISSNWAIHLRLLILPVFVGVAFIIAILGVTGQLKRFLYRPLPIDWVDIPARVFLMGSPEGDPDAHLDEFPQHQVYLDAYQVSRYLVTNQQYLQCVRAGICNKTSPAIDDPEKADHPVVNITWKDAQAFCNWNGGRLLTEAEWEMAARGGLIGALYPWGDEIDCSLANYGDCVGGTSPVGDYDPNGYGLYDMAGNVWEWVADWDSGSYYRNSPDENPAGPAEGEYRVLRGGSWGNIESRIRVAHRLFNLPSYPHDFIGFRCASSELP